MLYSVVLAQKGVTFCNICMLFVPDVLTEELIYEKESIIRFNLVNKMFCNLCFILT
jgi:Pyruvate/2-oxoacid:ferredoxin oxidoreductase delta subunit